MFASLVSNGRNYFSGKGPCTRLLAASTEGLIELEREGPGNPWRAKGFQLKDKYVGAVCYEPKQKLLWIGEFDGGVHFSADQGRSWEPRNEGLTSSKIWCLNYRETPEGLVLYCGVEPSMLFESRDMGKSWKELRAMREVPDADKWSYPPPPHIAHVNSMAFDPRDPKIFYVAIEQGALLKTTDGGVSWRELGSWAKADDSQYKDVHQIAVRPSNPDHLYMTVGVGFYFSRDAGETWTRATGNDFRLGYPDRMVISPDDDRSLLIAGSAYNPSDWFKTHDADAAVMRSRDGGETWKQVDGLPHMQGNIEAMSLYTWEGGHSIFIGNHNGNIFCSENFGDSWTQLASDLSPISKSGHHRITQMALAPSSPAHR